VEPIAAEVGQRLAGRYRLEERLSGDAGVERWRAVDELLARPVEVRLLPVDHDRARAVVEAAQLSATVSDGRFLQVLDAAEEDGRFYVVYEWAGGSTLTQILAAIGPLEPSDAHFMITEVAGALAAAHLAGLAHLRLSPDVVSFGDNGQIKVAGLAVDAALDGATAGDPALADAQAIGKLLHASLTARWPDGAAYGLLAAIRNDNSLATPRQVRAGVPALLDEIVDRCLNSPPKHHLVALTTPAAIAAALKTQPRPAAASRVQPDYRAQAATRAGLTATIPPAVAGSPVPSPVAEPLSDWEPSRGMRTARRLVSIVVIAGLVLLGALIARQTLDGTNGGGGANSGNTSSPNASTSLRQPLAIVSASGFDPQRGCGTCDGEENDDEAPRLFDDDADSAWSTKTYQNDPITVFKPGIGFVVDLGSPQQVGAVEVTMNTGHTRVELLTAESADPPAARAGFTAATDAVENDGGRFTLTPAAGTVDARYVLVWFTRLPEVPDGLFRAEVSNVKVLG
jgi:hypothetical protein